MSVPLLDDAAFHDNRFEHLTAPVVAIGQLGALRADRNTVYRCHAGFWLHGRWDRVLDTMDSRPGVGYGFPVPPPGGRPGPAGAQEPVQPR